MISYRSGGIKQAAPIEQKVERKPEKADTFREDLVRLQAMWLDPNITLEEIRKRTHWRSLGQISKIARNKLGLPGRFELRREKRMA